MFSVADLPDIVPLFPLSGAILLPRARLPLHVFEPRYLALLDDALKSSQRLIGIVQPVKNGDELRRVGCAGRLTSFTETEDGRYMITLIGVSRFEISEEISGFTPYRRAQVGWQKFHGDLGRPEHDKGFDRDAFLSILRRYLEAEELSTDWDRLKDAEDELLINSLSMMCPLSAEDKQALLEASALAHRREMLFALVQYALRGGSTDEVMQ